jgi:7,8-dihydroneopterin aldolase/epimerase/oxygenase
MQRQTDQIIISQLGVSTFIGATDEERRRPQRLNVSLVLELPGGFAGLGDRLENTVDYADVSRAVKSLAASGQRLLIETLAEEIAAHLLSEYPLSAVEVELRKFILPDAKHVAVKLRREK